MPVLNVQQSDWGNNVYVVTTTRIFVFAGVVYLGRNLYFLATWYSGAVTDTVPSARTSQGHNGRDHINMVSMTSGMTSTDPFIDININEDLELGLRQPQHSYQPHNNPYRPQVQRHERSLRPEASTTPDESIATAEQRTNVRSESADVGISRMGSIDISEGV